MQYAKPFYKHDCEECTFLGTVQSKAKTPIDLYFCPQAGLPTVIARFSDEDSDNVSGMPLALKRKGSWLYIAKMLAWYRGLITLQGKLTRREP
jgi:hypothetical protein